MVIAPGLQAGIDVGAGGTATVVGGANSSVVYLWHQKSLIWQATGTGNSISFGDGFSGLAPQQAPINALILNLLTGQGTNPFGGTLQVSHVDGVSGTKALGTYVVANNDGDDIDAGAAGGDALIIGGTGKDTLYGSGSPGSTSILVAGGGASNLVARSGAVIFVYNGGDDAVYGFNTTAGVADTLDLSSVAGVSNFAAVMADATPSGANTVLTFGAHQTVTLENVAPAQLAASEFIFAPIAGFAATTLSVAGAGTVVPIMLAITDAVSVDLSGGTPSLSLSDGATATYDVAASNPAGHLLVFDYTVGATDQAANLAVTGVNTNGATVTGANGKAVDFAASPNLPLGLQIGTPLTVSSETVSASGEADAGQTVTITLQMSQGVSVVLGSVAYGATGTPFGLLLNDGAVATYSANLSNQAAGTIVFTDTVAKTDHATNLAITGVIGLTPQINLATLTTVESSGGYTANFAAAIGAPTGLAIGPPVYVGGVSANAAASPTGVGEEADAGQTFQITLMLNEAVTVNTAGGSPTLTLSDGSIATYDAAASTPATGALVFDDTVGVSDHAANATISAVNLNGATVLAAGGQAANFGSAIGVAIGAGLQINPSPLTVTGVSATSSSSYGVASVTITLTLSEAAIETVPSSTDPQQIIEPGLVLNNGDIARFQSASGNQLTFSPIGAASDNVNLSVASVVLALGAGHGGAIATFTDANGYNADFTKALNVQTGATVGDPLYVASVTPSVTTAESQGGKLLQITLGLSEAATLSGGAPTLVLNDGGAATYDATASNLSTGALVFDYTPKAGEQFVSPVINTIDLNGATIADAGGNTADLTSFFGVPLQFQIGPSHILTAAISQIGSLTPGTSTELLLVMSQNVSIDTTGGAPSLTLSNGAIATYDAALTATTAADSASSVGQVVFDYTVGANDATKNLEISQVNLNGATFTDVVSGMAANLALPSTQFLGATVGGAAATIPAAGALPDVSGSFTATVDAMLQSVLASLTPAGAVPRAISVAGGGSAGAAVAGTLNAVAITSAGSGSTVTLPLGFAAGYLLSGAATLRDTAGGAALIATAAGGSLIGAANDTLFGGNSAETLFATTGAETLIGGTGPNAIFLGNSTALLTSQGADTITGSSVAATVNASGSALYFGTSGATNFKASGTGGDTIIGGTNGNTVQGGGGGQLIFGSTTLNFTGGSGAATIVGGGNGNTIVGGSGNELIFASSSLTYTGGSGAATIIGGSGPMSVNLGGGGVAFGSPNGSDTLFAGGGQAILVGGGSGDVLAASGSANDTLAAGGGAETLSGAGSTGNLVLFGGTGDDTLVGGTGNNLFIAESGNETLVGGGTSDSTVFIATPGTTRIDVLVGFNPNADAIGLFGYGDEPGADQAAFASATVSGGNTVVSLTDGTTIIFTGAPTLNSYNFF